MMNHPIIYHKIGRIIFIAWWIAISAIHSAILYFLYNIPINIAILDSVTIVVFFSLLTIGLWYWVRIFDIETSKPLSIAINHIGAAALSISLLISLHNNILQLSFTKETDYLSFLETSIPARVITYTLIYLLVAAIFYLIIYIQNFREKVSRESELKALVKEAELNWLKLQLNPHFLFNSLNSVSSLTISNPSKAQEMITRLSELLRYSLKQSPNSMVTVKDELDSCEKYLEIEKVRFGERLEYEINLPEECKDLLVPSMILQPLFENAIKHSVAQSVEVSTICANVKRDSLGTTITVTNTIPQNPSSAQGTGVGLENLRRRLDITFGLTNLLKVTNTGKEFTVSLLIPKII